MTRFNMFFLFVFLLIFPSAIAQGFRTHEVKKGESLEQIANHYQVSVDEIYKLNPDAKRRNINHMVLVIPAQEPKIKLNEKSKQLSFKSYQIRAKETLYSIAKENQLSIDELKQYNPDLVETDIAIGQTIKIPIFREDRRTPNFNESLTNSSFSNIIHIVLPGETKYRIAKQYGLSVEQLQALNPTLLDLKAGQLLTIVNKNPEALTNKNEAPLNFFTYEVKPKETIFRLTKKFKVPADSLYAWNPQLKQSGLQEGMQIKLPKKVNVQVAGLSTDKVNLAENISDYSTQKLAVMLPLSLGNINDDNKAEVLKKDKVLRIALDFYSGVEAAIRKAGSLGITVEAKVYDTQRNSQKVASLINNNDFDQVDFVVGPFFTKTVETASKLLESKKIPVLSPISSGEINGGVNLIQTRPTDIMMQQSIISFIKLHGADKNIVVLADKDKGYLESKILYTLPEAKLVNLQKEYLQQSDLARVLDKNRTNWFILESDDMATVSNAASYLNTLRSTFDIQLFTSNKNDLYDSEVPSTYLGNLNFTFAAINKEYNQDPLDEFVKMYREDYGLSPNQYVIRGYDVTLDAILRKANFSDFYESLILDQTTEYVENQFNYNKKLIGGYFNNAVYILQYNKELQIQSVEN
ncbi:LysM peptidoglycan-binding domain-containing protein [uncultured Mesonia sp.]|uniref:LysM peptidoglycan-binding domain-containing protein n=1 Tax=uncultured Mesonia sp. TaxID=399731 RepID=UPI00374E2E3E